MNSLSLKKREVVALSCDMSSHAVKTEGTRAEGADLSVVGECAQLDRGGDTSAVRTVHNNPE